MRNLQASFRPSLDPKFWLGICILLVWTFGDSMVSGFTLKVIFTLSDGWLMCCLIFFFTFCIVQKCWRFLGFQFVTEEPSIGAALTSRTYIPPSSWFCSKTSLSSLLCIDRNLLILAISLWMLNVYWLLEITHLSYSLHPKLRVPIWLMLFFKKRKPLIQPIKGLE